MGDSRLALSHTGIKQVLLLEIQLFKMSTLRTVSFFLCLLSVHAQSTCPAPNGYFVDSSRCDKYIECHDGVAENKECPDGLLFNVEAAPFRFPCDYPQEVKCESRAQPPIAKALDLEGSCIRRWGMFRASSDPPIADDLLTVSEERNSSSNVLKDSPGIQLSGVVNGLTTLTAAMLKSTLVSLALLLLKWRVLSHSIHIILTPLTVPNTLCALGVRVQDFMDVVTVWFSIL